MKATKIIFYISTTLFSLFILMGAYYELTGNQMALDGMAHLGYPAYFSYILGMAKVLGVIGIWQTFVPTIREWAYAGFLFDLIAAFISILATGDPISTTPPVFIALTLWLASYITYRKMSAETMKKMAA